MIEHLHQHFEAGYSERTLAEASQFIQALPDQRKKFPDVLFIDVSYKEADLEDFHTALAGNVLFNNVPVIYNEKLLSENQIIRLNQLKLIDDIMDIGSDEINFFSKIIFLKQSKIFNHFYAASKGLSKQPKNSAAKSFSFILKRILDITIASVCILLLLPLFVIIAILIRLESKGPIFYSALRAGKGFKVFKFYKFRSMKPNADQDVAKLLSFNQYGSTEENGATFFKVKDDPRITKFGKILRNTSADELPQLFNVLKGDMSLVGNRPLPLYEAEKLTTNEFVERFNAPAGITGLWQVNKRGKADMSTEERINLDIVYSRDGNILYDLKILVKTPVALFQKSDV
ncbi:MAG: sugar transferase [Williamsia sp.]|nr:sugar transferase [Williamsia sp.]